MLRKIEHFYACIRNAFKIESRLGEVRFFFRSIKQNASGKYVSRSINKNR